jgi:hypothetical protein
MELSRRISQRQIGADALMQGKVDVAILRRETHTIGLAFKFLIKEPQYVQAR